MELSKTQRVADAITSFAGSMIFVYIHIAWFASWMLWFEKSPWPMLTLIVSLEAIFLSTFVLIAQNRATEMDRQILRKDYLADSETNTIVERIADKLGVDRSDLGDRNE
jgi:uncharacterized membrane protein